MKNPLLRKSAKLYCSGGRAITTASREKKGERREYSREITAPSILFRGGKRVEFVSYMARVVRLARKKLGSGGVGRGDAMLLRLKKGEIVVD